MPIKKISIKKSAQEKTGFYSIGATIGKLAGGIIAGKNGVMETVKSTIQNITTTKKSAPEKTVKITTKKVASKQLSPATKKSVKPSIVKKTSPPKKVTKSVSSKKSTQAKKIIKKPTKKVAKKMICNPMQVTNNF